MHPTAAIALLLTTLISASTTAQGLVTADETLHYGVLEAKSFGGGCAIPGLAVEVEGGTIDLASDSSYTGGGFEWRVCPDGSLHSSTSSDSGSYALRADGRLLVRSASAPPTSPPLELRLRFDHGLLLARVEAGHLVVSGGSFNESELRHAVSATATVDTPYAASGTITALADGRLRVDPGGRPGAVSADGEMLFWVERNGTEVAMTVAVRRGSAYTAADLDGAWHIGDYEFETGSSAGLPRVTSRQGRMLVQTGPGTYGLSGTSTRAGALRHGAAGGSLGVFVLSGLPVPGGTGRRQHDTGVGLRHLPVVAASDAGGRRHLVVAVDAAAARTGPGGPRQLPAEARPADEFAADGRILRRFPPPRPQPGACERMTASTIPPDLSPSAPCAWYDVVNLMKLRVTVSVCRLSQSATPLPIELTNTLSIV